MGMVALPLAVWLAGCTSGGQNVRGAAPTAGGTIVRVRDVIKLKPSEPVTVEGEMVEKCATAGCWFKLRDKTGIVRVDTRAAGFVVSDVPLHTHILVGGRMLTGEESTVAATGIRY